MTFKAMSAILTIGRAFNIAFEIMQASDKEKSLIAEEEGMKSSKKERYCKISNLNTNLHTTAEDGKSGIVEEDDTYLSFTKYCLYIKKHFYSKSFSIALRESIGDL